MLLRVLSAVEDDLADLTDRIPIPSLQNFRNAAIACLKQMARSPQLFDDSFTDPDKIGSDPIYQAYLQATRSDTWEKNALRQGLLYSLLLEGAKDGDYQDLLEAIRHPPILTCIDPPPDSHLRRIALVATFYECKSQQDAKCCRPAITLAMLLEKILAYSPTPEEFRVTDDQRNAIASLVETGRNIAREPTSSEILKKLSISLNTRIGQSIRHLHAPAIVRLPDAYQVGELLQWLQVTNPDVGSFAAINTLLSGFAGAVLGKAGPHRYKVEGDRYSALLKIQSPDLEKCSSPPDGCGWMAIDTSLYLPIPLRVLRMASQLKQSHAYSFDAAKLRFRDAVNAWKDNHGVDINLGRLHMLLPAQLGPEGTFDNTLLHLLGLKDISSRDAGIHYFSPHAAEIIRRYQRAVETLAIRTALAEWMEEGWTDCLVPDHGFGASVRPSLNGLVALVSFLEEAARRTRGRTSLENRIRNFNAEAARLTVLFLASTGARPVESVFPERDQWSAESRTLLLSEKDSLLYRSTRTMPIVDRLWVGVKRFTERKHALEVELGRRFDQRLIVFLVDADGNPQYPTISNLKARVPGFADHWPWPNDVLRHHFRSRLWEMGCPSSILERAMGHLGKSQTPDAMYSMEPVGDATSGIAPYVGQLLDEIGF